MSSFAFTPLFEAWEYRDINAPLPVPKAEEALRTPSAPPPAIFTEEQMGELLRAARTEAAEEVERRWMAREAAQDAQRTAQVNATLGAFAEQRTAYFRRVEDEVVHLALAIAKKILHREAELDPTLLAALVRIALDRMGAGPTVKLRLPSEDLAKWQEQDIFKSSRYACELIVDDKLQAGDCVVETELGVANFGFDAQLKEVEQGLVDLLAQRPAAQ